MSDQKKRTMLNIGFGSTVVAQRVIAVLSSGSAPMKRLKDEAKKERRLVDATHGRKTRSIIVMDDTHVFLSAYHPGTISQRYQGLHDTDKVEEELEEETN